MIRLIQPMGNSIVIHGSGHQASGWSISKEENNFIIDLAHFDSIFIVNSNTYFSASRQLFS